jgi:hypothetical protein
MKNVLRHENKEVRKKIELCFANKGGGQMGGSLFWGEIPLGCCVSNVLLVCLLGCFSCEI